MPQFMSTPVHSYFIITIIIVTERCWLNVRLISLLLGCHPKLTSTMSQSQPLCEVILVLFTNGLGVPRQKYKIDKQN